MTGENQTADEILAIVESLLKDTYAALKKLEADEDTSEYNLGEINAYRMMLDAFAEAGFDIDKQD